MGPVHVGIGSQVAALDPFDGRELWRTRLESGRKFVSLALRDGRLYAGLHGQVYCLDPATGAVLWHNPMKGTGFGLVSFAATPETAAAKAQMDEEAAAAAATAAAASS